MGESHIFSPQRVLLCSPQLPHERHFCLAVKYIALHLLLMRFALVFFSSLPPPTPISFKRLIFGPGSQIFIPSRLTENLRGSVGAQSLKGKLKT